MIKSLFKILKKIKNRLFPRLEKKELNRIKLIPRYREGCTSILGPKLKFIDSASFLFMYNEIFKKEIYKFYTNSSQPLIIDAGANIGLSVIYFKKLYPEAKIIAFEPDINAFKSLSFNLNSFKLSNVDIINKALWNKKAKVKFYQEGADGGRLSQDVNKSIIEVETEVLSNYLSRKVDFLKLDIEGAEVQVLTESKDRLNNVENLFVEYHSFVNKKQELDILLRIIKEAGFRYYIEHIGIYSKHPFIKINSYLDIDLQLNIFAYRHKNINI